MSYADRGKSAEQQFKDFLATLERDNVASYRWPDARGGSLVVAPADFMTLRRGQMYLYEIKEVAHEFRLPHGNFGLDQIARMRLWKLAGAKSFVLIKHSKTKLWRWAEIEYFRERVGGSWDLRDLNTYESPREAFNAMPMEN